MKKIILSFFIAFIAYSNISAQPIKSLFTDKKGKKVGDLITILIVEEVQADNSAKTNDSRTTDLGAGVGISTGATNSNYKLDINSSNAFTGQGETARSENVQAKITAKVVAIDDAGNLKLEGKRLTQINGEKQTIMISGTARFDDISTNNAVYSYNLMDLSLTIDGDGVVTKANEPGLFTKFLRALF